MVHLQTQLQRILSDATASRTTNGIRSDKIAFFKFFFFQCGTEFFKKEGDEYKKLPFSIAPENCCEILSNDRYKQAMANQTLPKECPIKAVSIIIFQPVTGVKYTLNLFRYFMEFI
jgi:hypothetical protein